MQLWLQLQLQLHLQLQLQIAGCLRPAQNACLLEPVQPVSQDA